MEAAAAEPVFAADTATTMEHDEAGGPCAATAAPDEEATPPETAWAPPAFRPGQRVELTGLQSAPERNGTFGRVVSWNDERQRFEVQLEADGANLRVRPVNLVAAPSAEHAAGRSLPLDQDQPFGKQWARQGSKDDVARLIQSHDPSFRSGRPLIRSGEHLRTLMAEGLETTLRTDFCWSLNFTPLFLAQLVFEGFLPICSDLSGDEGLYVLLPKWHCTRCCMKFDELHVSKTARKRAKKFRLTADKCFDEVIDRCVEQHGENWLYPPMRAAFRALHHWGQARDAQRRVSAGTVEGCGVAGEPAEATTQLEPLPAGFPALLEDVRFHSFEVWSADGTLAAGEFGAVVGGVYTSFTGFFDTKFSGAGSCLSRLVASLHLPVFFVLLLAQRHTLAGLLNERVCPHVPSFAEVTARAAGCELQEPCNCAPWRSFCRRPALRSGIKRSLRVLYLNGCFSRKPLGGQEKRVFFNKCLSEQGPGTRNSVSALFTVSALRCDWRSALSVSNCWLGRYKVELGAKLLPREEFLAEFRAARGVVTALGRGPGLDAARGVIGEPLNSLPRATATSVIL